MEELVNRNGGQILGVGEDEGTGEIWDGGVVE